MQKSFPVPQSLSDAALDGAAKPRAVSATTATTDITRLIMNLLSKISGNEVCPRVNRSITSGEISSFL